MKKLLTSLFNVCNLLSTKSTVKHHIFVDNATAYSVSGSREARKGTALQSLSHTGCAVFFVGGV